MASEDKPQPSETNGKDSTSKDTNPAEKNGRDSAPKDTESAETNGTSDGKLAEAKEKLTVTKQKVHDKKHPPGGPDSTPIPRASDGYTVRFTFHRAENLPVSDFGVRSSDPYIHATLTSGLAKRHKEDPDMVLRTPTIHKNVNPVWNTQWTVAGIPSSGFRLKCRLYDEDPSDHDDRLGNVTIYVDQLNGRWPGIREEGHSIKKRMGSKRAYMVRGCVAMLSRNVHMSGTLYVSAEVLGESEKPHGRMYTLGVTSWYKHYSPMIGRLAKTKAPGTTSGDDSNVVQRYDFQANQFQLQGPVPPDLYNRFVEFKPFVKGMFSNAGLRGRVLNKALQHQHSRVYNFSGSTEYGVVEPRSEEAALQFLKMVHFDEGGRIFTYVLTLDGLMRFTETGKEFGIDLLSKHTMHSDVNIYVAHAGEFFVRRLARPDRSAESPAQATHPAEDVPGGPPHAPPPKDPRQYELVIDNDSGTYRPRADLLPQLQSFLEANFPGLQIVVKDCQDDELAKMKDEQRERKKTEGDNVLLVQNSHSDADGDVSSSDEERLERRDRVAGQTRRERAFEAMENPRRAVKAGLHKDSAV